MKNKEICTECGKEFEFSDELDENFDLTSAKDCSVLTVYKYPRTPEMKFCSSYCMHTNLFEAHF